MTVTYRSYAKINLTLDVLGQRPDGFHEVRTVLQTISLHDTLCLERSDGPIEVTCADPSVPEDEANLVSVAAQAYRREKGVRAGARITIIKRIPVAAGLGGGSSNAAVALLALQDLWQVPLSTEELFKLGSDVGSDVPFFFYGGTAIGVGRGSEVYPLPSLHLNNLLLVRPRVEVSAGEAYAALSRDRRLTKWNVRSMIPDSCKAVLDAWGPPGKETQGLAWIETGRNDLESVVTSRHQEIGQIVDQLRQLGAAGIRMSGSGPTVFAHFEDGQQMGKAETALAGQGWHVIRSRTVDREEYWKTLIE